MVVIEKPCFYTGHPECRIPNDGSDKNDLPIEDDIPQLRMSDSEDEHRLRAIIAAT